MRNKRYKIAFFFAAVASIFLFLSGTTGRQNIEKLEHILSMYIHSEIITYLFFIPIIIASFGALAVLLGGYLVLKKNVILGNVFMALGSGAGIITFVIQLMVSVVNARLTLDMSFSSLGVICALIAQFFASEKRLKKIFK